MRKKRNSSIEIHVSHLIGRFDSKKERKKEIHKNNTKKRRERCGERHFLHLLCYLSSSLYKISRTSSISLGDCVCFCLKEKTFQTKSSTCKSKNFDFHDLKMFITR